MDIDSDKLGIPETDYDARVTLPSSEFGRIVRDLSQLGESVRIEVTKEGVRFTSEGEAANGSVLLKQSDAIGKVPKKEEGEDDEDEEKEKESEDEDEDDDEEKPKKKEKKEKKGKRPRADNDNDDDKIDHRTKKSRSDSSGYLYNNDPPPDVQCAYYGAERLAALFGTTHSIVILLTGKSTLRLRRQFLTCGY